MTWPIWAIGAATVAIRRQPEWQYLPATGERRRVQPHLWTVGIAALAAWIFILPLTQPEQQLRRSVERDLRAGRIAEGLATMSAHQRGDFPPHWDPPPRLAYREHKPDIVELQVRLQDLRVKPWVRELYDAKFGNSLRGESSDMGVWWELPPQEIARRIAVLERLPDREAVLRDQADGLRIRAEEGDLPADLEQRIAALLKEIGVTIEPRDPPVAESSAAISSP